MLYFEEEETKNEQKINMNSLVCVIWEMFFKKCFEFRFDFIFFFYKKGCRNRRVQEGVVIS